MPTFVALLFAVFPPSPSIAPPPLHIELVFIGRRMRPRVEAFALREAAAIWAPYHVTVSTGLPDVLREDGHMRLAVVLDDRADRLRAVGALGAVRFRAATPEPTIDLFVGAIDALVAETPALHRGAECPPAIREQMTGRMAGRALAHEIGHVLLRSRGHSGDGLMRATHQSPDLVAPERTGFDLSADDARRIDAIVASLREQMIRGSSTTVEGR